MLIEFDFIDTVECRPQHSSVASGDLIRHWWICAGVAQVVSKRS